MSHRIASLLLAGALAVPGFFVASSCSGSSSPAQGGFQLVSISVPEGTIWKINKAIEMRFNAEVDLLSVVFGSTIQIQTPGGQSAFGKLAYKTVGGVEDRTTLVFQPFCPTLSDLSDAGFKPGGTAYKIFLPGKASGAGFTIKSLGGVALETAQTRNFTTPNSFDPTVVFADTAIGPPAFVSAQVQIGSQAPIDLATPSTPVPGLLPLNFYSDSEERLTYIVQLNQAVDPSSSNINDTNVRIEFDADPDPVGTDWQALQTQVQIETNCPIDANGAQLSLTPVGILPQDVDLRVVLDSGFTDLVGQGGVVQTGFQGRTRTVAFPSLTPSTDSSDEILEEFDVGGTLPTSLEDTDAIFDTPSAVWDDGRLRAGFDFTGTGGPNGDFDWHVTGTKFFSTDVDSITGGPNGVPSQTISVVGGVVDVNDLVINPNAVLRVQGTQPLTILATGDVTIAGTIDISGFDAQPVGSLFIPFQPETGAVGVARSGSGGTGSFLTTTSTPCGGDGFGAFEVPNAGGKGGETGFTTSSNKQHRRGGGGGGGRFALDQGGTLSATAGGTGHAQGFGAKSTTDQPKGGQPGVGPFTDGILTNDFWGKQAIFDGGGALTDVIEGELAIPFAGYGGGAGGDSINGASFPTVPFCCPYKDKKGCGGGSGGGQLRIIALGKIIFQSDGSTQGQILCTGGNGATGENVLGFDHIAGSSGGGSGGHVILESATQIDFTDGGNNLPAASDFVSAIGANGGIGQTGGLTGNSSGGRGGPGLIQYHVPEANPALAVGTNPVVNKIVLPSTGGGESLADVTTPTGLVLIPNFGARSKARSKWIALGGAKLEPDGTPGPVVFDFDGTDPDDAGPTPGQINSTANVVDELPPLLGPEGLGLTAPAPVVDAGGFTLILDATSLLPLVNDVPPPGLPSDDMYLRNASLLRNFVLRLRDQTTTVTEDFVVVNGLYDAATGADLRITVDSEGNSLASFLASHGGATNVEYELVPRFFEVETGGLADQLPDTGYISILFQATAVGPDGLPDETAPVVDWTPDITDLNGVTPGDIDFFRFEVEFNLDSAAAGLTVDSEASSLNFLRLPFLF